MRVDDILRQCTGLIDSMLEQRLNQEAIDLIYEDFVEMHMSEMSKFMKELDQTPRAKKFLGHSRKPYRTEMLTEKWKECHEAERVYEKANKDEYGNIAPKSRSEFLYRKFDKLVKKAKRSHERSKVYNLEKANSEDPIAFWRTIQQLGPKKLSNIP